jgi:uncharacterized protein (TIGR02147 family)
VPQPKPARAASQRKSAVADGPQVFAYLDYRAFLRDYYATKKASRGLSFRSFARRAGLSSPNYLKLVIEGQRNLTPTTAARFAKAASLEGDAARYFAELVVFTQAKTSAERNQSYARITSYRRYREARPLELAHAAYHSTWYLPAIRELACRPDFREDPEWIAAALWPSISAADALQAMRVLLQLGLLSRTPAGKIVQSDAVVSTGPEAAEVNVANYHRMMMQRASEAVDAVPPTERDISSLTLCLGPQGLRRVKERIQKFRRELLELSTREDGLEQVVQVNFQLFPLSRPSTR